MAIAPMFHPIAIILALNAWQHAFAALKPEQQASSVSTFQMALSQRLQLSNGKCPLANKPGLSICIQCDASKSAELFCPSKDGPDQCKGPAGANGAGKAVKVSEVTDQVCGFLFASDADAQKDCKDAVKLDASVCDSKSAQDMTTIQQLLPPAPKYIPDANFYAGQAALVEQSLRRELKPVLKKDKCTSGGPICIACIKERFWKRAVAYFCPKDKEECPAADASYNLKGIEMLLTTEVKDGCAFVTDDKTRIDACIDHVDAITESGEICRKGSVADVPELAAMFKKPAPPFRRNDAFRKSIGNLVWEVAREILKTGGDQKCPTADHSVCAGCEDGQPVTRVYCYKTGPNGCQPLPEGVRIEVLNPSKPQFREAVCKGIFREYSDAVAHCMDHMLQVVGPAVCKPGAFADITKFVDLYLAPTSAKQPAGGNQAAAKPQSQKT